MIKAVIFDYFGVISGRSLGRFVSDYFSDDQLEQVGQIRRMADVGLLSRQQLRDKLAQLAGVSVGVVMNYESSTQIDEELISYIRQNLKPHYKIGILSNASADYAKEKMSKQDYELFDDILVSYHFGLVKPDPLIYMLAAKRLGINTDEAVFVDDKEECASGAKAVGMQAVLYRDLPRMKTDLEKILAAGSND